VHIFSAHSIPKLADVILKKGERETLEKPLVSRAKTANTMIRVERSLGISKNKAQPIIEEFLDNMKASSIYPETHLKRIEVKVVKKLLNDVINKLITINKKLYAKLSDAYMIKAKELFNIYKSNYFNF
jgi:hypothetical protein